MVCIQLKIVLNQATQAIYVKISFLLIKQNESFFEGKLWSQFFNISDYRKNLIQIEKLALYNLHIQRVFFLSNFSLW